MKVEGVSSKATTFYYIHSDWSQVPVPCKTNKALRRVPEPAGSDSSCSLWCNGDACNRRIFSPITSGNNGSNNRYQRYHNGT
jgi:hypothetical protein